MKELSYCLIVNKSSNSGRAIHVINKHLLQIQSYLKNFEIYEVGEAESISEIASLKAQKFDVVVACGGDGTARSVATGIKDHEALLGILPLGSGNDFAKMLGLTNSFLDNLNVLKNGVTQDLDIGVVNNNTYFINTFGLGFDGYTNYLASKTKIKGSLKYIVSGLRALFISKSFNATIKTEDGSETFNTLMIIVANGKWEGGKYFVSPKSLNNDGVMELIILKKISRINLAFEFIKLSLGKPLPNDLIVHKHVNKVTINTSLPIFNHADGEIEKNDNSFSIDLISGKIKVLIQKF